MLRDNPTHIAARLHSRGRCSKPRLREDNNMDAVPVLVVQWPHLLHDGVVGVHAQRDAFYDAERAQDQRKVGRYLHEAGGMRSSFQ